MNFLKKAEKSQPLRLFQATDEKPIFEALGKDGEQLQKEIMDDLNENPSFPKSPEWPKQEISRWKEGVQEREEEKGRLESLNVGTERALEEKLSQLMSMADTCGGSPPSLMSLEIMETGKSSKRGKQKMVHQSGVDLKSIIDDADLTVSPQSTEEKSQEIARQLWKKSKWMKSLRDKGQDSKLRKHLRGVEIHSLTVRSSG